jgi:aspartokinase
MSDKQEDLESRIIREMFEEIMKMIRDKQIKLESIVQKVSEQGTISKESFERVYKILEEYGKKKQWI